MIFMATAFGGLFLITLINCMEQFPKIRNASVVLIRADRNTGHILDHNYRIVLSNDQTVYTVVKSIEDAKEFAQELLRINTSVEVVICSHRQEILYWSDPQWFRIQCC